MMSALSGSPRRATRTPGRPRPSHSADPDSGPPLKKRKYVPGGPGGGGRWVNPEEAQELGVHSDDDEIKYETPGRREGSVPEGEEAATPVILFPPEEGGSPETVRRPGRRPASSRPRRDRDRERTRTRPATTPRPRYSSAAAAAAASQASDGYKPREERSWEEFHPDLDIEADLMVFTADEVDGRGRNEQKPPLLRNATTMGSLDGEPGISSEATVIAPPSGLPNHIQEDGTFVTPKRKPGRPPRRPESMLSGLGSPPAPRITPLPTHNPKERLNLPKPSFRFIDTFSSFEQDPAVQVNFVDKSMANVGYQESDRFDVPKGVLIRHVDGPYEDEGEAGLVLESDEKPAVPVAPAVGRVEYDMDEQDEKWLEAHNMHRKEEQAEAIKPSIFEITMTQIEKEYHALEKRIPKPNPRHAQTHRPRSSSAAAVNGEPAAPGDEPDSKCAICDDGDCENANAIIFCDGCDLAVHQECYGVPFIPEGQWFCRKCKEIGRGTPTCIFCPNIDGAFKQTNTLRWSHLLCAIWIPEVNIANPTFMEPIQDVEKVPKGRWSLNCYICNQKMGACIQCGNKNCYQAFHVTCARRARLYLRMKSSYAGGIDTSVLKAFCDRHVPPDWRSEHDTSNAIFEAKRYYRHTMRNRRWADSQTAALAMYPVQQANPADMVDELGPAEDNGTIVVAGTKRKRSSPQRAGWRLPSGAPVVPAAVFNTVETSLMRFTIRRRKEFVTEACKYWTLKREARKGAALLKRLQLQLESFSTMEITRRNFVGMGAAGRPRLQRRIEFADILSKDMDGLQKLAKSVREREQTKLTDVDILRQLLDTVYFPVSPLLWPIFTKARKSDEKNQFFKNGFDEIEQRLNERYYTSVAVFMFDLASAISPILAQSDPTHHSADVHDLKTIFYQLNQHKAGTTEHMTLSEEQKKLKSTTKRIVKAVLEQCETAMEKEAQLKGLPYEKDLSAWADFDARLENSDASRRMSSTNGALSEKIAASVSAIAGASPSPKQSISSGGDVEIRDAERADSKLSNDDLQSARSTRAAAAHPTPLPADKPASYASSTHSSSFKSTDKPTEPLSPPISTSSTAQINMPSVAAQGHSQLLHSVEDPMARGGIPWYVADFDPMGTTVHDERWTGPEQIRAMSEALSEMDEETLLSLMDGKDDADEGKEVTGRITRKSNGRAGKKAATGAAPVTEEAGGDAEGKGQAEEEREKKDKINAKRRAARRRTKW